MEPSTPGALNPSPLDYAPPRRRRWITAGLSWWHLAIPLVLWLGFGVPTMLAMRALPLRSSATTAASVALGPMAGAVVRDYQGCCLEFSVKLLPWCAGALAAALAVQLLVPPVGWWRKCLRVIAWFAGVFFWFAGAIASFLHALS